MVASLLPCPSGLFVGPSIWNAVILIFPRVGEVKLQALGKKGLARGSAGECLAQEQLQRK